MIQHVQSSNALSQVQETSSSTSAAEASAPPATLLPQPSPMLGDDIGAEIAALAVKTGKLQQDIDTKAAETQDAIQDQADAAQVSTLHDEATTMREGAWESGLTQIGAGFCSMGAGAAGAKDSPNLAQFLKGGSEALGGTSTLLGGLSKAAATDSEALATAQKALADAAQRSGTAARDGQKNASDFIQSAIDFYREYQSTKAEAQAAAVHGA